MFQLKPIQCFIFLLALALSSNAQNISPYKFSLGVNLMSYNEQLPIGGTVYSDNNYKSNFVNGIIFKVRNNLYSVRLGVNYINQNQDNSYLDNLKIGGGFEREFLYSMLRPVLGLDLFYYRSQFDGEKNATDLQIIRNGGGFSPFIGLKFYPIDRLTLSATTSFDGIWFQETSKLTSSGEISSETGKYRYESVFHPVAGLTLIYNFGTED